MTIEAGEPEASQSLLNDLRLGDKRRERRVMLRSKESRALE